MSMKYINDKEEFENIIKSEYIDPKTEKIKKIDELNIKITGLKRKQDSLYDDKFNNIITVETYQRLFNNAEEEINIVKSKLKILKKEVSSIQKENSDYNEYLEIVENFLKMKNPTKEIMNRLIEKIYITKDKTLEIHYRIKKNELTV